MSLGKEAIASLQNICIRPQRLLIYTPGGTFPIQLQLSHAVPPPFFFSFTLRQILAILQHPTPNNKQTNKQQQHPIGLLQLFVLAVVHHRFCVPRVELGVQRSALLRGDAQNRLHVHTPALTALRFDRSLGCFLFCFAFKTGRRETDTER